VELKMAGSIRSRKKYGGHARNPERTPPRLLKLLSKASAGYWYTPPEIFSALGLTFDLDPCSPGPGHWMSARHVYTKADDGLAQSWQGCVFMNPAVRWPARPSALAAEVPRARQRHRNRAYTSAG
jgi:hypothetical protein